MRRLGIAITVLGVAIIALGIFVGVQSIPDVKRYLKMRGM